MGPRSFLFGGLLVLALCCPVSAIAQSAWQPGHAGIAFSQPGGNQAVRLISPAHFDIRAGMQTRTAQDVTLQFAIQNGLHINSHRPRSSYLIPTQLTLEQVSGIQVAEIEYPSGTEYHFEFSPKEMLSVYTGDFGLIAHLLARPGHYTLHGKLNYQACDNRACNPPKALPVVLEINAR